MTFNMSTQRMFTIDEVMPSIEFARSPLYLVMDEPVLHHFISFLEAKKRQQEANPNEPYRLALSKGYITRVRESFRTEILRGELRLHLLAHLLASHFLGEEFELHGNAIGILPGGENRPFIIHERLGRETLFSQTDLDLGNQMIEKFRYSTPEGWRPLSLAANYVEYLPPHHPSTGVNRLTSRVKAEEEIWNKVADEIFRLDMLVERDKHLRQYSKYIKDVFGLKIVCEDEGACSRVHEALRDLQSDDCDWAVLAEAFGADRVAQWQNPGRPLLFFVETKDYLTCDPAIMKKTGWKAVKSVVKWQQLLFEIQVQPLSNYYLEIDHMSGPSHQSFKQTRDALRTRFAESIPLYGFYRNLLRVVFMEQASHYQEGNSSVLVVDGDADPV